MKVPLPARTCMATQAERSSGVKLEMSPAHPKLTGSHPSMARCWGDRKPPTLCATRRRPPFWRPSTSRALGYLILYSPSSRTHVAAVFYEALHRCGIVVRSTSQQLSGCQRIVPAESRRVEPGQRTNEEKHGCTGQNNTSLRKRRISGITTFNRHERCIAHSPITEAQRAILTSPPSTTTDRTNRSPCLQTTMADCQIPEAAATRARRSLSAMAPGTRIVTPSCCPI